MSDETFEPAAFQTVSEPKQLKAFSDPLRARLLRLLSNRPATNQQLADAVGEPQAKVLHHGRTLLNAGLIVLVEERIRGGNVEKYYRATARLYAFRPTPDETAPLAGAVFDSVTQEVVSAATRWPDSPPTWEGRRARIAPARLEEFKERLQALIAEYWGTPDAPIEPDGNHPTMALMTVTYRYPGDEEDR